MSGRETDGEEHLGEETRRPCAETVCSTESGEE